MDNDGELRLLPNDCWTRVTLSSQGEHQDREAGHSYHTFEIPFPDALDIRVGRVLLETTSGELFAFIAAGAGAGNDDHQMEVDVQETEEQLRRSREVILSRCRQSQMSPRKSWNF